MSQLSLILTKRKRVGDILSVWFNLISERPEMIRFLIPWLASLYAKYSLRDANALYDAQPWIVYEAKEWLASYLQKDHRVFEWGSGGSSLWISRRVREIISVEHDHAWYRRVEEALLNNNIHNCKLVLVEPEPLLCSKDKTTIPTIYASETRKYKNMSFERYARTIESFDDESFDLIVVDGSARSACIWHALRKVRAGGFLMLDNSERSLYKEGVDLLTAWKRLDFFGPGPYSSRFSQTSLWQRVKE